MKLVLTLAVIGAVYAVARVNPKQVETALLNRGIGNLYRSSWKRMDWYR